MGWVKSKFRTLVSLLHVMKTVIGTRQSLQTCAYVDFTQTDTGSYLAREMDRESLIPRLNKQRQFQSSPRSWAIRNCEDNCIAASLPQITLCRPTTALLVNVSNNKWWGKLQFKPIKIRLYHQQVKFQEIQIPCHMYQYELEASTNLSIISCSFFWFAAASLLISGFK